MKVSRKGHKETLSLGISRAAGFAWRKKYSPACLVASAILFGQLVINQAAMADPASGSKPANAASPWKFSITPYAWAFGVYGKVGVGNQTADVDATFLDVLRDSDSLVALEGHIEVQYERFGIFFDGSYADIGAKYEGEFLKADIHQELTFIEGGLFYRVIEDLPLWNPSPEIGGGKITVDALAGVRYTYIGLDTSDSLTVFNRTVKRDFDPNTDWVDPIIGARLLLGLTENIDFSLRGDIGGFGAGSDFTWNTQALFGYHFPLWSATGEAWAGYRAMGQDYDQGSGRNAFKWDVVFRGPIMGMTVRW